MSLQQSYSIGEVIASLGAGLWIGLVVGSLGVVATTVRRVSAERDVARRKVWLLVSALRPFAPVHVKKITCGVLPRGHRWHYWSCSSPACGSNPGILGGPPSDVATLSRVNDEAREHYLDEHMTRENIERAAAALREVLGERWRR